MTFSSSVSRTVANVLTVGLSLAFGAAMVVAAAKQNQRTLRERRLAGLWAVRRRRAIPVIIVRW